MRLTPHFDTREFACHNGAAAPVSSYRQLDKLCNLYLEPLRHEYGIVTVISGYRTKRYNRLVGGVPGSYHVYRAARIGVGADIRCQHGTPRAWYELLDELHAEGLGLYASHVHVDSRLGHARW